MDNSEALERPAARLHPVALTDDRYWQALRRG